MSSYSGELSPDGRRWWTGQAWCSISPDGCNWWDGSSWQPVATVTSSLPSLSLAEEFVLLAMDNPWRAFPLRPRMASAALAGAALMDLRLRGHLRSDGKDVVLVDSITTGDDLLDRSLAAIAARKHPWQVRRWVWKLQDNLFRSDGFGKVEDRLIALGVIRHEGTRPPLMINYLGSGRYPATDPRPVLDLRARIRRVLVDKDTPDLRTASLIGLGQACSFLPMRVGQFVMSDVNRAPGEVGMDQNSLQQRMDEVRQSDPMLDEVVQAVILGDPPT